MLLLHHSNESEIPNDVEWEAVVVDVKDGAHDQMEVIVYVFKMNEILSFPHPTGFTAWSFITLRVLNGTGYKAELNLRVKTRLYKFKAEERECGKGAEDFLVRGVINQKWAPEENWTADHFFVDHRTLGLIKVPLDVWGNARKKQCVIGRLQPSEVHNGEKCYFIVEKLDPKIQRNGYSSDDDSESDDSDSEFDWPELWIPTDVRRRREREAREREQQRKID